MTTDQTKPVEWTEAPEGFEESASGDLEGYWDPASPGRGKDGLGGGQKFGLGPITFTPLHVTVSDSDIDEEKSSTLIHCRLEAAAVLRPADKNNKEPREFPAGTLFGIWAKPGMKPLKTLAGVKVWMANGQKQADGTVLYFKNINRPSPMVVFTIKWPKGAEGKKLRILEDHRVTSRPGGAPKAASEDEFIPF
ncbi:MAG TPA: hypothetical protein VGK73_03970 [Polyangiaceae bacterium]